MVVDVGCGASTGSFEVVGCSIQLSLALVDVASGAAARSQGRGVEPALGGVMVPACFFGASFRVLKRVAVLSGGHIDLLQPGVGNADRRLELFAFLGTQQLDAARSS